MAGHSHWANIQHKKAAVDKKRGKIFSKIARKIIAAAKAGGGDPGTNIKLKYAVQAARAANMSNDQVKRAIKRAVGGNDGDEYEELVYEGYAPGGAAVLVEALTDNRNRTSGDVRSIFSKRGGNLGATGSVAWQFARRAIVRVAGDTVTEDALMDVVLEAGAEDLDEMDGVFEVRGPPDALGALQEGVSAAGLTALSCEVSYVPSDGLPVDEKVATQVAALLEALEELDDVQNVHTNVEFPEGFEG